MRNTWCSGQFSFRQVPPRGKVLRSQGAGNRKTRLKRQDAKMQVCWLLGVLVSSLFLLLFGSVSLGFLFSLCSAYWLLSKLGSLPRFTCLLVAWLLGFYFSSGFPASVHFALLLGFFSPYMILGFGFLAFPCLSRYINSSASLRFTESS